MKRVLIFALAFVWLPLMAVAQDVPEDRYIAIYDQIQQADALSDANNTKAAHAKYVTAQADLVQFQKDFPNWQTKIVNFRLNYLAGKTSTSAPAPVPAEPSAPVEKNAVAPAAAPAAADGPDLLLLSLQSQVRQLEADNAALEDKLKAAQSKPGLSAADTAKAAQAEDRLKSLQDENDLLKKSLKEMQGRPAGSVDASTIQRLGQDLTSAKTKLEEQGRTITALKQEKEVLQKRVEAAPGSKGDAVLLEAQVKQLADEKSALERKLAAATMDAKQLAAANDQIKQLQRENSLLRASAEKNPSAAIQFTNTLAIEQLKQSLADSNRKLQEQADLVVKLNADNDALQKKLSAASSETTAKELAQTKKDFAALKRKYSIQTDAALILLTEANIKISRMTRTNSAILKQNQSLQSQLNSLASNARFVVEGLKSENETLRRQASENHGGAGTNTSPDFERLQSQLAALRAKVSVLEAQPVPFTADELALFRKPETASLAKESTDKKAKKLPANTSDLLAEAQHAFAGHDYDKAREKYLEVLKLDKKNVFTLGNLATIELEMDKLDDAEAHLQQALAIKPNDPFSLGALGNLRFRQGKYTAALDALSHAAELNPNDAEIQNFLGVTLSQKGQRAAAETALRKAIQIDPQYGSAHNNLAVIYLTQTPPQVELARWHYQKALAAGQPRNPELEKMMDDADHGGAK